MWRLAFAFSLLILISCKKDKGSGGFSLVGQWKSVAEYNGNTAWGGCSCWKEHNSLQQHIIEFKFDGTYTFTPSLLSSFSGCNGDFQRTSDSTLSWNKCGADPRTFYFSYQPPFLVIEERPAGGPYRIKYKRM